MTEIFAIIMISQDNLAKVMELRQGYLSNSNDYTINLPR